ncbi:hypothetical protein CQA73_28400, partial [Escherichia coli]
RWRLFFVEPAKILVPQTTPLNHGHLLGRMGIPALSKMLAAGVNFMVVHDMAAAGVYSLLNRRKSLFLKQRHLTTVIFSAAWVFQ